jgi:hypothetical protein
MLVVREDIEKHGQRRVGLHQHSGPSTLDSCQDRRCSGACTASPVDFQMPDQVF